MRAACRSPAWAYQACAEPGDKLPGPHSGEGGWWWPQTSAHSDLPQLRLDVCTLQPSLPHARIRGGVITRNPTGQTEAGSNVASPYLVPLRRAPSGSEFTSLRFGNKSPSLSHSPFAATVSRGTLRPVIYLGRECAASVTSCPPPVWTDVASCNIYTVPRCYRDRPACPS